jgi:DNA-binding MarR family transcriptional regulator
MPIDHYRRGMPDQRDTTPDYVDLVLPVLLAQARLTYTRGIRAALDREGFDDMPRAGARVVGRLARGGTSVTEVAGAYDVSKQAASKLVDALVMRGYVDRVPDEHDRRRLNVALTDRGRGAAAVVRDTVEEIDGRLLAAVGPAEAYRMRQVLAVLAALGDGVSEPELGPEPTG